jgi:hypothetical protein
MKIILGCIVLITSLAWGQDVKRIALTPTSSVPSATIFTEIGKHCSGLVLTMDASKADYLLEAVGNDPRNHRHNFELTLFESNGDVLTQSRTALLGNAIKDICRTIGRAK